jgi:lactoylglutathione lyase
MKPKLTYTGIRVKDLEKSIAFYTQVMGMKVRGRSKQDHTKGETVDLISEDGSQQLELNYYGEGSKFATDYTAGDGVDHLAFQVEDLDKFFAGAASAGHPQVLEMKTVTSRYGYIEDPNGIWIEIFA